MKRLLMYGTASALAQILLLPVHAQSTSGSFGGEETLQEFIVTGSRIARRDFVATSPIVTQDAEVLQQSGAVTLEKSLQQLPQFAAGTGETTGGTGGGNGGRATVNLRSLGDIRNLVLLDGRRLPTASVLGHTDINVIPQSIISSVETITGGASAIYGSDAMSGVVNFRTRDNVEGFQIDAQFGDTFRFDRQTKDISLVTGGAYGPDGRGRFLLSLGYTDRQQLIADKRSFFELGTLSSFLGYGAYAPSANNLPSQAAVNNLFAGYGVTGVNVSRSNPFGFNDDGTVFTVTGALNYRGRTSGDYVVFDGNVRFPVAKTYDVVSPMNRKSLFLKTDYQFTDGVTGYAQVLYVNQMVQTNGAWSLTQFGTLPSIPVTNPFIPDDLRTLLASRPDPDAPFSFNGRYYGLPQKIFHEGASTYQFILGLRGALPIKDWTWDVYGSASRSDRTNTNTRGVLLDRVQTVFNAPDGGNSICAGGYNPFGDAHATSISEACQNYLTAVLTNTEVVRQRVVEGSLQGSLFRLPYGDVRFSLVADYRDNDFVSRPDSQRETPGQVQAQNPTVGVQGKTEVGEIAAEVLVPVLRDVPLVKEFNIDAAYRYSHYDLSGGASTYKVDGDWTVVDGLMIRGGYARAIRAPNVGELFSAATGGQAGVGNPPAAGEPCDVRTLARQNGGSQLRSLCIATGIPASIVDSYIFPTTATASVTAGNRNLRPEVADTYTLGVVLRPDLFMDGLSNLQISVDYYSITISDVIATINGQSAINKCYNQDGSNPDYSPANEFCMLLHRDPNGQLELVDATYLNLGGLKTSGIDTVVDWRIGAGPGQVTFNSVIGYKIAYEQQTFSNTPWQNFAGTINPGYYPKWQALTTLGYNWGPAGVNLRMKYLDHMKDGTSVTRPASPSPGVPSYVSFDITGQWAMNDMVSLRAGITNLADRQPLMVGGTPGSTNASIYDTLGRSFYIGVRTKL